MSGSWKLGWATSDVVTAAEFGKGVGCIDDQTLSNSAATIAIPSSGAIPSGCSALRIVCDLRSELSGFDSDAACIRFNGDDDDVYYMQYDRSNSSTSSSGESLTQTEAEFGLIPGGDGGAGLFGQYEILVPNYTNTHHHKLFSSWGGVILSAATGDLYTERRTMLWGDASGFEAITSATLLTSSGSDFSAGSRVTTYVMGA